jgi:Big-like domain-containing protein
MKLSTSAIRNSLFILAVIFALAEIPSAANAQDNPEADKQATTRSKFPAAKAQSAAASKDADADAPKQKAVEKDKDGQDELRKRDEWFYKQRSSANGHIPAGARAKSLAHMQRMMEAEGKLVHRPDGSVAEVTPFAGSVTNTWTSIGPTPTVGGEFSPVTGRITTIAIDPTDATGSTVLIGGAQGGIWRTTNAGATWAAVGDQNASLAMGSIAFAPSAPATVYAGTGEQASIGFDVYYGAGVLKSTNGGLTWTQTCTTAGPTCPFIGPFDPGLEPGFGFFSDGGARISYIAVNPTNANLVLAAAQVTNLQTGNFTAGGIYCSTDGGATWTNLVTNLGAGSFVGFASSTVAYAAIGDPFGGTANGIYKSTNANGGATPSCSAITFTQQTAAALPPQPSMGRIDLGIAPSDTTGNTVYASIADGTNGSNDNLGVWVTTNGGTSWTQTPAPDACDAQCWYDNVVKVDPSNAAIAFFGGAALGNLNTAGWVQRTTNTGSAWTSVIPTVQEAGLPHVDVHAMAFIKLTAGVRMYMGNDGGIWRTDNAEATPVVWTNLNDSTLTLTQFYPAISIHPSSQAFAFAGAQDNGSQIYSQPTTGTSWTDNQICGDGTGTAIDNVVPSTVYVDCNGIGGLAVSTINGQINTFFTATNGINPADNASFVPPLVTDPSTANTAYVGTTKVYQSVNTGSSWTALTSDLVNGANGEDLTALVVAPGNPKVVYAGANTGQIFVATNVTAGAGTFAPVAGQSSLPPRQVGAITVDPADATGNTAYAAFSGFSFVAHGISDPIGHLFKTTNGGTTWTDVSCTVDTTTAGCSTPAATDLPNSPVNDVVVDPDVPGTLYAATDIGVFQGTCTTSGTTTCTWTTLSTGLPRVAVLSLKLHHASRTLRAATHGRGVWDIVLNNFSFAGPHISSISPVSTFAGGGGFTLTVNGNGLTGGAVQWNGSVTNVTTQPVSDSQLTATIATALVGGAGTPQITVKVGTTTSNPLTFTVLGGTPTITAVTPTSAPVNSAATPITVTGTGFASNVLVVMNPDVGGTAFITPTSVNANGTQISAMVPASFMAGFGSTNSVGVQNPPPGGGIASSATNPTALPTFVVVAPAPANDNFANAISITTNSFSDTRDSSAATTQTSDPAPPCSQDPTQIPFTTGISNTIWYKFVPTASGTISDVDTIGSSYDTVLSIWTGSGTTETSLTATLVACNDDIVSGIDIQSQIQGIPVTAGTPYYIMVSSFGQADPNPIAFGGESILNFTFSGTASNPTPTITAPLVPATATAGGAAFTLTINGTNFVSGATVSFGTTTGLAPSSITAMQILVTIPATAIATAGTPGVIVTNPAPGGGPSNSVAFTVSASSGSFTLGGGAATVTAGSSGPSAITLTPTGGFAGAVAITCGTTLPGVTCSPLNVTVPSGGGNGTGSLVVNVAAPSSGTTAMNLPGAQNLWAATKLAKAHAVGWWTLSGGTGFAAILLLFLPGRKRYRAALGLGLVCVLSFALGCGGGSGGGGGGGGGGTTATTTHLTVSGTKVAAMGTLTVSATVTGGTPTGNVQFFVDGAAAGNAVPVAAGTTGNIMLTAASAPPLFQLIGTHTLSAHYLGDATTSASSSGTLNIAVTGTTQLPISANPASSNANVTISLTIN